VFNLHEFSAVSPLNSEVCSEIVLVPPIIKSWGRSVSIVTRLQDGWLWFDSWQGQGFYLLTIAFTPALGPTQPPIQWVLGVLSLPIKQPGCEADNSPPSNA